MQDTSVPPEPRFPFRASSWVLVFLAGVIAFGWLSINLNARYLWQDEAMTAVLGERFMKFGKPLGYDGKNLITMDVTAVTEKEVYASTTVSAEAALEYYSQRRDFKPDTSWTGHPWGQFLLSGLSTSMFGRTTLAARVPFVLFAALSVILLAEWTQRLFQSRLVALLSILLLLGNVFWFAHMRQCRYYALSCFFSLATLRFYWSWSAGNRWAAIAFMTSAWLLFQSDFGTFFPLLVSLFLVSWLDRTRSPVAILIVFSILALSIIPFVFFYGLFDRLKFPFVSWDMRLFGNIFQIHQYMIPLPLVAFVIWRIQDPKRTLPPNTRRFFLMTLLFGGCLIIWLMLVSPYPFHRYVVAFSSLAAIVVAWCCGELAESVVRSKWASNALAAGIALLLLVSPILASPISDFLPDQIQPIHGIGFFVRSELRFLRAEIFGSKLVDPNRATIEFLKERLKPGDEVLINYEDMPVMFYLDNPVRGGIPGFRVSQRTGPPPRFVVIRASVRYSPFQWAVIDRFLKETRLKEIKTKIPDTPWGYCPDPFLTYVEIGPPPRKAYVFECLGWR